MIGYLIANALRNELPDREVVALLTEVVVDEGDPAFRTPTKRIGPVYPSARLAAPPGSTAGGLRGTARI
jgi:carbamate kinase